MKPIAIFRFLLACLLAALTGICAAQDWPAKPVRLIVPYPVGTSNEVFARVVAQQLSEKWGQSVLVDAIPGAGGVVGTQVLAKAPNDGYTLGWISSPHAINPAIYRNIPYDSVKDFRPIVNLASTPLVFVAGTGFRADDMAGLIAMAKAAPGTLNFASNGNGSASHLATELLASMAGVKFTHVPYKSTGQMTADMVSGRIQFAAVGLATSQSLVKAGKLKALGITGSKRSASMPEVAAVDETVPGYEAKAWMGLVAPAGAPDAVVARVAADAAAVVRDPVIQQRMAAQALEPELMDAAHFGKRIEGDIRTWARVIKDAGIQLQ